jgi:hypothetical protein
MFESLFSWLAVHSIKILVILIAVILINRIGKKFIEKTVRRAVKEIDHEAEEKRENTLIRIFGGTLKVILWLIALMTILPEFGIEVGPILAGAGILGVALGFGAQWMIRFSGRPLYYFGKPIPGGRRSLPGQHLWWGGGHYFEKNNSAGFGWESSSYSQRFF